MKNRNRKTIRLKTIRAVYETFNIEADDFDPNSPITNSGQVYELLKYLIDETKEHFITLHLDSKNKILAIDHVSTGSMSANVVHPREVMKTALLSSAAALLCIHNHPSGNPDPSREDIDITRRLNDAAEVMGLRLLDHVIVGDGCYVSFADRGLLESSTSNQTLLIRA